MTQPLDPQTIKERAQQDWDLAAAGWQKHDRRVVETAAPVTRRLLELAGLAPGQRVLDIACGTGEPALPAADAVVGVDIDYETVGNNMMMVSASGTAVRVG